MLTLIPTRPTHKENFVYCFDYVKAKRVKDLKSFMLLKNVIPLDED